MSLTRRLLGAAALLAVLAQTAEAQWARRTAEIGITTPDKGLLRQVYFTEGSATELDVGAATLTGHFLRALTETEDNVSLWGLAIDRRRGHLYVGSEGTTNALLRYNLDGTGRTVIASFAINGAPQGVALDEVGERLYMIFPGKPDRIRSCALDGSDMRALVRFNAMTPGVSPYSIHVDSVNRRIYWWDSAYEGFRAGLITAGDDVNCLTDVYETGFAVSHEVDTTNDYLYWTESFSMGAARLYRAPVHDLGNPCGSNPCDETSCPPALFAAETLGTFRLGSLCVLPENPRGSPEEGVVAWIVGNNTLRWRELEGVWPVPVSKPATFPPGLLIRGIEVVPGPSIFIRSITSLSALGEAPVLHVAGGSPGSAFVVRLVELDGQRLEGRLDVGRLDEQGAATYTLPHVPALSGSPISLEVLVLDPATEQVVRRGTTARLP